MVNVLYYISRVRKREKHKENGRREMSVIAVRRRTKPKRGPSGKTIKKKYLPARNVTYSFVYPSILHPGVFQCSPCCLIVYVEASLGNSLWKAMISSSPAANALERENATKRIAISSCGIFMKFIVFLLSFTLLSVIKQKRVRVLKESRLLRFFRSDDARVVNSSSSQYY